MEKYTVHLLAGYHFATFRPEINLECYDIMVAT